MGRDQDYPGALEDTFLFVDWERPGAGKSFGALWTPAGQAAAISSITPSRYRSTWPRGSAGDRAFVERLRLVASTAVGLLLAFELCEAMFQTDDDVLQVLDEGDQCFALCM